MVNWKYCKKTLVNTKEVANIDRVNYNFNTGTKIFLNENLRLANEFITKKCHSLKHSGKIQCCFTRNDVVYLKIDKRSKPVQMHHLNKFNELFEYIDVNGDENAL